MATMTLGRLGEHLLGEPNILRFDYVVNKLRPLTRFEVSWLWKYLKNEEINSLKLNHESKDVLIGLVHAGYLIKKRKNIYSFSDLGYLYYKKLKDRADELARGIDILSKPLLLTPSYFANLDWRRGYYDPTRVIFTDYKIVLRTNRILNTVKAKATDYRKLPKDIEDKIREQVSMICSRLSYSQRIQPYKFQRKHFLKPGIVWFKSIDDNQIFPLSEIYFDYLFIHSGKLIATDNFYLVKHESLNLFAFFSDRLSINLTLKDHLIAYVAGLNTATEELS